MSWQRRHAVSDELGELSLQAQVRLLRTLQNHVVERVGSTTSIPWMFGS
ncbi:MAG: sigma 54-interacting transcriptional regulator [Bilophila wadsworthia]